MATYIAYGFGKMNQSVAMKDERNALVFEANLVKFRLLSASDFEFVNKKTTIKQLYKVGKTRTTEMGTGHSSFTTSSYFKLNGENVFEVLEKKGYHFKMLTKLNVIHPEFAMVDNNGTQLATYKLNVKGERQEGVKGIGKSQRNILITTQSQDLETIFLGAFILSKVDISAYLL